MKEPTCEECNHLPVCKHAPKMLEPMCPYYESEEMVGSKKK